jgi:hypothetical protein
MTASGNSGSIAEDWKMGFFDALRRVLTHDTHAHVSNETQKRIRAAWGLDDEESTARAAPDAGPGASAYDRSRWQKRLRRILEELPASEPQWHELLTEAHALELEPSWIAVQEREEFAFLVRRAVSHRVVTEEEHRKLDLARKLIELPEAEAEQILHSVMAEAEAFFGAPVKDES